MKMEFSASIKEIRARDQIVVSNSNPHFRFVGFKSGTDNNRLVNSSPFFYPDLQPQRKSKMFEGELKFKCADWYYKIVVT